MENVAGWVAPIATTIAALMTAANLGARVTGWGFIVFTVGSLAWLAFGVATGQSNLLWQNVVLTAINLVGIWRWLGREARLDDGAEAASRDSVRGSAATLFPVTRLSGAAVNDPSGTPVATSVGAMVECGSGRIAYVMLREGDVAGVGGKLHAVDWHSLSATADGLSLRVAPDTLAALPVVAPADWPHEVPHV